MSDDLPRIGRYEVITRLAIGGMAELFLARERGIAGLERLVVLKRILPQLADKPRFIDMFLREARIAARLAHPNVVQIFDLGEDEGTFFIAMEYINGSTVRELQVLSEKHGRLFPLDVTVGVLIQSLRGLHAAHELRDLDDRSLGLVHRDVSPHNIMCTTDGSVKLLDFGVAKATEEGLEATYSGHLKGKFAYMSPEQARREGLDRRSDVFSMGVVGWEMLTGQRLFKRDAEMDMMAAVLAESIEPPSAINPQVPEAIDHVIMRALERDRDERFKSADAMRQELVAAATKGQLDISHDPVAEWVEVVAGTYLELRKETLQKALEHNLTAYERDGLLHVTGSESHSIDTEIDIPLAVKMTQDAIRESKERSASKSASHAEPAGRSLETVIANPTAEESRQQPAPKPSRGKAALLAVLAMFMVAGALAIALKGRGGEPTDQEPVLLGEPFKIAWSPTIDPSILRKELEPLRKYLERATGRPVQLEITKSYKDSSEKLLKNEVSFALLPPLMYVRTRAQDTGVEVLAIKLFDGASHSDGLILTRGESKIRKLAELEGKTFCFTDRNSTTGHFLPRAYIRGQGFDPEKFIGKIHWSGDHLQALRDLIAKKCDAAAVYSGAFISADRFGIPISQLQQIALTGNVPQDPIVVGPRVSASDREAMRSALLAFDPQKELGKPHLGETQRITAFEAGDDARFDFLREIIAETEPAAGKEK